MLEELRVILEAEAEGRRQFDAAREQAARIVQQAEEEARRRVRAAREARLADAAAVQEAIVRDAEQHASRLLAEADATAAAMQVRTAPRLEAAVEAIVAFILAGRADDAQ